MMKIIQSISDIHIQNQLKEKYLEVITMEKKINEERFHTSLGIHYIRTLFDLYPREHKDKSNLSGNPNYEKVKSYLSKLNKFL